jgi:hypothetical protein
MSFFGVSGMACPSGWPRRRACRLGQAVVGTASKKGRDGQNGQEGGEAVGRGMTSPVDAHGAEYRQGNETRPLSTCPGHVFGRFSAQALSAAYFA